MLALTAASILLTTLIDAWHSKNHRLTSFTEVCAIVTLAVFVSPSTHTSRTACHSYPACLAPCVEFAAPIQFVEPEWAVLHALYAAKLSMSCHAMQCQVQHSVVPKRCSRVSELL